MSYFIERRFNILDAMVIAALSIFIAQGQFVLALITVCVGIFVALITQAYFGKRAKDRQWQVLARQDLKVRAIKRHRELYGSSLKEALDAVQAYQATLK
jgi:ribosomal protein L7/L12